MAAVAWIGDRETAWHVCRFLSACVTALAALLAARTAHRLGVRRSWLVIPACYAQPLNTLLAYTTLTENFAALYLIAAIRLLVSRRVILASAVFSLVLLTRHEAVILVPIWWAAIFTRHKLTRGSLCAVALSVWAPVVHNLAFRVGFGSWPVAMFLAGSGSTDYAPGGLLSYLPRAMLAIPPVMLALAIVGGVGLLRRRTWLLPAIAGLYLATHCALMARGLFASGGFARFMVAIAPLVAILIVHGWNLLDDRLRGPRSPRAAWIAIAAVWLFGVAAIELERRSGRLSFDDTGLYRAGIIAALAASAIAVVPLALGGRIRARTQRRLAFVLLLLTAGAQWVAIVRPLHLRPNQLQAAEVLAFLRDQSLDARPIFTTNPWLSHWLGLVEDPTIHKGPRLLSAMPVGTIVVWESLYSDNDYHGMELVMLRDSAAYRLLRSFPATGDRRQAFHVYEKTASTPIPQSPDQIYPPNPMADPTSTADEYYIRPSQN